MERSPSRSCQPESSLMSRTRNFIGTRGESRRSSWRRSELWRSSGSATFSSPRRSFGVRRSDMERISLDASGGGEKFGEQRDEDVAHAVGGLGHFFVAERLMADAGR